MRIIFLSLLIRENKATLLSCFANSTFCRMVGTEAKKNIAPSVSFYKLELAPGSVYYCPWEREQLQQVGKLLVNQQVFIGHSSSVFRTLWFWVWNVFPFEDFSGRSVVGKHYSAHEMKGNMHFHSWICSCTIPSQKGESRFERKEPGRQIECNNNIPKSPKKENSLLYHIQRWKFVYLIT